MAGQYEEERTRQATVRTHESVFSSLLSGVMVVVTPLDEEIRFSCLMHAHPASIPTMFVESCAGAVFEPCVEGPVLPRARSSSGTQRPLGANIPVASTLMTTL